MIGWPNRKLNDEKKAERDALLRIMIRAMQALIEKRLVRYQNIICEQRLEKKIPRKSPGLFHYEEQKTLRPDPQWGLDHPDGTWALEMLVQVDQDERMTNGNENRVDGAILSRLFASELEEWIKTRRKEKYASPPEAEAVTMTAKKVPVPRVRHTKLAKNNGKNEKAQVVASSAIKIPVAATAQQDFFVLLQ